MNDSFHRWLRLQGVTDLLLIHGLTYDHHTWDLLLPHLTPGRRVLAVDLPGHGANPPQEQDLTAVAYSATRAVQVAERLKRGTL